MLALPDFNGDGHTDVAQASHGGAVLVTSFPPGSPQAVTPRWVLPGPARALASAIDVNADGFGDLLVARQEVVDVYYGGEAGLTLVRVLTGGPGFGARLAGVGDVNGDGFGDVVVGSQPDGGSGSAALYLSSPTGLAEPSGAPLPMGRFGGAADVNADGFADVVVCSPVTGKASLYFGSPQGLMLAGSLADPRATGVVSFGNDCQGVGDVNGDGFGDLVVTGADQTPIGVIYFGAETGLPAAGPILKVTGKSAETLFMASAGDTNRDGYTDVAMATDTGVHLFLGAAAGPAPGATATLAGDHRTAAGVGDFDADRASDLLVAPQACDQPVRIVRGDAANFGSTTVFRFEPGGTPLCPGHLLAR
jgi:hypothetical protein